MSKKRKTFSLDRDIHSQLTDREQLNASAVVNELLRQYLVQGNGQDVGLRMRLKDIDREIEQKQSEIGRIEAQIDRLQQEREDIQAQIQQRREEGIEEVQEFAEKIQDGMFDTENLTEDNPAVENFATKAGLTPERFIEKVQRRL